MFHRYCMSGRSRLNNGVLTIRDAAYACRLFTPGRAELDQGSYICVNLRVGSGFFVIDGNKASVSGNDKYWWYKDKETR